MIAREDWGDIGEGIIYKVRISGESGDFFIWLKENDMIDFDKDRFEKEYLCKENIICGNQMAIAS